MLSLQTSPSKLLGGVVSGLSPIRAGMSPGVKGSQNMLNRASTQKVSVMSESSVIVKKRIENLERAYKSIVKDVKRIIFQEAQ